MNVYEQRATRRLNNWIKHRRSFKTGTGKVNRILTSEPKQFTFSSVQTGHTQRLSHRKLKAALTFVFRQQIVTRKQLEAFSPYSSALMGLLITALKGMCRVTLGKRGLRLILIGVRFFFSGCDRAVRDLEVAKANGAAFILMSYYYLRDDHRERWKHHIKRLGLRVMLDSGAFTVWNQQKRGKIVKPLCVNDYAAFITKHQDVLHSYMNLDVVGNTFASSQNEQTLRKQRLEPIPVFPAGCDLRELDRMLDADPAFIAIGASVGLSEKQKRNYFTQLFDHAPNGRFHWLGGASSILNDFPWVSADSSTWLSGRKYGKLIGADFKTVTSPKTLSGFQALAHNVRRLAQLEYNGIDALECRIESGK